MNIKEKLYILAFWLVVIFLIAIGSGVTLGYILYSLSVTFFAVLAFIGLFKLWE